MTLRKKITLIVLFICSVLASITYVGTQSIIMKSYLGLEEKQAKDNMGRVYHALNEMQDSVLRMTGSWAVWDDTYQFIQDRNKAYIHSNLTPESFASTNLDLILYFDNTGKLAYSLTLDPSKTKSMPLPDHLMQFLPPSSPFIHITDINGEKKGFISLPTGLLLIAARPIVTSKNTGPIRGTIMMAKYFSKDDLQNINKFTKINVSLFPINEAEKSPPLNAIIKKIVVKNNPILIKPNNQTMSQYELLYDINKKPIYLLKTTEPRSVYEIGYKTTRYYGAVIMFYSIVFAVFLWVLLQQLIVKRLESFISSLYDFKKSKSIIEKITRKIPDEVSAATTLYHQATHDPLTGLANRNLLYQAFNHYSKKLVDSKIAILFLDMDKFKQVNDALGHDIGDKLLIAMGEKLSSCLRENDLAARLGGDEFVVMLVDINEDQILTIINRIFSVLSTPVFIEEHKLYLHSSMGVSVFPENGDNIADLIKQADVALYKAKENGSNQHQFFSNALSQEIHLAKQKEIELQFALDRNEFCLYYQPIYDALSKQIISIEALLRWRHPKKGLLVAGEFIELAERTGIIIPLGKWVLNAVCKQLKSWQEQGFLVRPIAVNLSAIQTNYTSIYQIISNILNEHQLDPHLLELELTETGFIKLNTEILSNLRQLRDKGVQLSVDDFGVGYSGLKYLRKLPINKIKIDKSFVLDIENDPDAKAITLAIISIAHQMNLKVIAEGVETQSEYEFLLKNHVDGIQGYFFCPPISAEQCEKLLGKIMESQLIE